MNLYHVFFALFAVSASFAATVDLSQLAGDYEAKNGDVLTGTLEGEVQPYKITIADGLALLAWGTVPSNSKARM